MSEKRLWMMVLALVSVLAVSAAAQNEKNEVSVVVGRDLISKQAIQGANFFDPFIRYGNGLSFEGSYARRIRITDIYSVSGEIPLLFNPDEDLHAGGTGLVTKDYKALFVAPSFRVNLFPGTAFSPWGSIGGGFGHFSENSLLLYGGTNTGKSTSTGVLQYGFGLDVRLKRRLFLRGEARDFWSGQPDFPLSPTGKTRQHNYFVGGGVAWRF
jgi:hypothetical protein